MIDPAGPVHGRQRRTRIKVCGIRDEASARHAVESGVDALGFVFVRASARHISPERAREIMDVLPPFVASVGVFVNASLDAFCDVEEVCPTTLAQLSGNENEALVRQCGPFVIKAVRCAGADTSAWRDELQRWDAVDEVDAILVDVTLPEGAPVDWPAVALATRDLQTPVILGGVLTPANVGAAVRIVRPFGVDVSGGVEREPGVKDPALLEAFCDAVRAADAF